MRVLAIGCHPDDLEINCYGTLAKYVKMGHEVYICGVSNGDQGHVQIMPEELAVIRKGEAANAAKVIGAKEYYNLDGHDLLISRYDMELVNKLVDYIRKVNPDVIITQPPNDYMMDHVETSALVFRCAFMACIPHYCTTPGNYPETVPAPIPIYYMSADTKPGFQPTQFVDITDEMDLKVKAMECHKSQLVWLKEHDNIDIVDDMKAASKVYGGHVGTKYAEAFQLCEHASRTTAKNLLPE